MYNPSISLMKDGEPMSESNIVARFNEIYDATSKSILAFITVRCGNTADIDDIFQETYMELYQILNKYGAEYITDGKAYVFRIVKRKIAQNYSLLKRLQMFVSMTVKNEDNENIEIELSDSEAISFLTEDFVVDKIMLDNIRQFIKQKPPDIEQIFYFFYDMDMTIAEIAQALSLSESNVKNKIYRTISELKNLLK